MKKVFLMFILFSLLVSGCKKEMTIQDLEKIKVDIEDKFAESGDYDNFISCYVDEGLMKVVVELYDISSEKQQSFKNNVYDSEYIIFQKGFEEEELGDIYLIDELSMEISNIKNTSMTLKVINYNDIPFTYTSDYCLFKYEDDNWVELNKKISSSEIKYYVANSNIEMDINWQDIYGILPKGEYQITKEIFLNGELTIPNTLSANFTIS